LRFVCDKCVKCCSLSLIFFALVALLLVGVVVLPPARPPVLPDNYPYRYIPNGGGNSGNTDNWVSISSILKADGRAGSARRNSRRADFISAPAKSEGAAGAHYHTCGFMEPIIVRCGGYEIHSTRVTATLRGPQGRLDWFRTYWLTHWLTQSATYFQYRMDF
jgi:hypothetical protein